LSPARSRPQDLGKSPDLGADPSQGTPAHIQSSVGTVIEALPEARDNADFSESLTVRKEPPITLSRALAILHN